SASGDCPRKSRRIRRSQPHRLRLSTLESMLTDARIESILTRLPFLSIGVLGDLFLDRYLDIDRALTEPSLETGLDAWQVVRVRCCAGAAGTILNNLAALGVGRVCPVSLLGEDGEGYEVRR